MSDLAREIGKHSFEGEAGRSPRFFDPWLICDNRYVEVIADNVAHRWESNGLTTPRQRKRRQADQVAFETIIHAVYANLAYAVAEDDGPPTVAVALAKPTGKRSRYDAEGFGQLPQILELMARAGLLILRKSRTRGIASAIEAPAGMVADLHRFKRFGIGDFRQRPGGETIIVSHVDQDQASGVRTTRRIEYSDTDFPDAARLRREMELINSALNEMPLALAPDDGAPVATGRRRLRRIFNTPDDQPRFDLGGRLYGGWWEDLERGRRHGIRIDGERTADLDFSAMFLRLAYARAGITAPDGDLYAGILQDDSDGRYREGLKVVVNAMLFRLEPLQRLPKGSPALLPPASSGASIRDAILRCHSAIRGTFETGVGLSLMKTESDILVAVLLRLLEAGIRALPIHDGLMVRRDLANKTAAIMGDVAEAIAGVRLPVKASFL